MSRDAVMEQKMAVLGFVMLIALLKYPYYFNSSSIEGHKILLTDSESVLGQEIAMQYAKYKTKLMLVARNESSIRTLADRCLQAGAAEVHIWSADLSDAGERERLMDEAANRLGGNLHQVVLNHFHTRYEPAPWELNAGMATDKHRHVDDVDRMMDRHFRSYVDLASRSIPLLTSNKGGLGAVMPLLGKIPVARMPGYSSSMAAITGFFPALRQELWQRRLHVSVTSVALGQVTSEDGSEQTLGKNYPFPGGWLAGTTSMAADQVIEAVSLKKSEMTYPYVSQVQYALYSLFPSTYEGHLRHLFNA